MLQIQDNNPYFQILTAFFNECGINTLFAFVVDVRSLDFPCGTKQIQLFFRQYFKPLFLKYFVQKLLIISEDQRNYKEIRILKRALYDAPGLIHKHIYTFHPYTPILLRLGSIVAQFRKNARKTEVFDDKRF